MFKISPDNPKIPIPIELQRDVYILNNILKEEITDFDKFWELMTKKLPRSLRTLKRLVTLLKFHGEKFTHYKLEMSKHSLGTRQYEIIEKTIKENSAVLDVLLSDIQIITGRLILMLKDYPVILAAIKKDTISGLAVSRDFEDKWIKAEKMDVREIDYSKKITEKETRIDDIEKSAEKICKQLYSEFKSEYREINDLIENLKRIIKDIFFIRKALPNKTEEELSIVYLRRENIDQIEKKIEKSEKDLLDGFREMEKVANKFRKHTITNKRIFELLNTYSFIRGA